MKLLSIPIVVLLACAVHAQTVTEAWYDADSLFKEGIMITTDASENIVATGFIWLDDMYTKKYAPDGTLLWESVSSALSGSVFERPYWVHTDTAENVIVVGEKYILSLGQDYNTGMVVVKYDPSGGLLWKRTYDGAFGTMRSYVDEAGNIYVATAGQFSGDASFGSVLRKLDANGNIMWTRYKYFGGLYFQLHMLRANASEDRFILVSSNTYPIPATAYVVFDDGGNEIWSSTTPAGSWPRDALFDEDDNAYVTYGVGDVMLTKYDASGNDLWTKAYDIDGSNDQALRIVRNTDGKLVVMARSSSMYLYLIGLDTAGTELWRSAYTDNILGIYGQFIDADESGNVYVSGDFSGFIVTLKYDTDGNQIWKQQRSGNRGVALSVGKDNSVNVVAWYGMPVIRYIQDPPVTCFPPDSSLVSNITPTSAKIFWSPAPDAYAYEIWGRKASGTSWKTKAVPGFKHALPVNILAPCTDYVAKIRTVCDSSFTTFSDFGPDMAFTTSGCKFRADSAPSVSMWIYPNPASEYVYVAVRDLSPAFVQLHLIDMQGRLVYEYSGRAEDGSLQHRIGLKGMAPGLYTVRLQTTGNSYSERIVLTGR